MILPQHMQSLLALVLDAPENTGLFEALMSLIEGSGDSEIILHVLDRFPQEWIDAAPEASRVRAVQLAKQADRVDRAKAWLRPSKEAGKSSEPKDQTVVSLFAEQSVPDASPIENGFKPNVTMDDIAGLSSVKQEVQRRIIRPFQSPDLYQRFRRKSGGGILLYGPPGCGKTMMAKAVAGSCDANFIEVSSSDIFDRYWGVAEKRIADIFERARRSAPSILFFDEVECLTHRRGDGTSAYKSDIISSILKEMDGFSGRAEGVLILGATNVPWTIDPAFRRPGRFDKTLFVPPPDKVARLYLLKKLLSDRPVSDDIDHDLIVKNTAGYSGADLEALIDGAIDFAIDESSAQNVLVKLSARHFDYALTDHSSTIGEWLALASSYVEHSGNREQYKSLKTFLKKYSRLG